MKRFRQQETFGEKTYRYRGVALVVSIPLLLIVVVVLAMPRGSHVGNANSGDPDLVFDRTSLQLVSHRRSKPLSSSSVNKYAVVFDAGSSGSRVHVYRFGENMELVPIDNGSELELFRQTKPGLSSYAGSAEKAVDSLRSLLNDAINVVPSEQRSSTPVRLGATAGLRALPGDSADTLLQAVSTFLMESPFKFETDWVSILDGTEEGAYEWVTINYLLGNIGKDYANTVGVVDLGGGSVQMAYAISEEASKNAPKPVEGEDAYVKELNLLGKTYHLYVHSYLRYGLLAARAEVLKQVINNESCPCVAGGFEGTYTYSSNNYRAVGSNSGADFDECQALIVKALHRDQACKHMQCTFGGVWSGGGGDGQKKLFVASFFFDRAMQAGIIADENAIEAKLKPVDFKTAARTVCSLNVNDIGDKYSKIDESDRPYFCLDLAYQYTLLVEGFGIDKDQEMTLVKKVKYKKSSVEAAWPLGSAIDVLSS